jgi:uncharacterized membrane protein
MRGALGFPPQTARRALAIALCGFLLTSGLPFGPASAASTPQFSSEVIGGRTWLGDFRVTTNALDDDEPQIAVDASGSIRFLWRQQTGGNGSFMFAEFGATGDPIQNETFIASNVTAPYPVGSPHGDWAAVDSSNNIHVVGERDPWNISYEQFDMNGTSTVGPRQVGPADASLSERPVVAIQGDDTVHVAYGDYKFQCEDVVYAKLANNGTEIWTNRVVSADVAALTNNTIERTSPFSGNVLFTFGSDRGSWLGRFDRYGVKNMPSVKFRNATDFKPADVAEGADGSMHLVWEDNGTLYYSAVNATGVKVVDAAVLEANGTVGAFPRVAVSSRGLVMIAWEDNRSGAPEVMIGEIPATGNLSAWMSYTITSAAGDAFDPVVAFTNNDQPVVAWSDTRYGNREIMFKRAVGCGMELYGDPIELAGMYFLHPDQTNVTQFHLKNKGLLADSFSIDLSYTPGAAALGWIVSIDTTYAADVPPGGVVPVNLTIHVPANAKQGDNISVSVNATSLSWSDCWDRIDMNSFVQVTRSLGLLADTSLKSADNGETVAFHLLANNTGDVRENTVNVVMDPSRFPTGWTASSNASAFGLDPHESASFTVWVTVPNDTALAPASYLARIPVSIQSVADPTVTATRELQVSVNSRFEIALTGDTNEREVRNDESTDFTIEIANVGNLAGQAQINLAASLAGEAGWVALLDRETVFLRGGESTSVRLTVRVPINAAPGTLITYVVNATAPRFGVTTQISFTIRVPPLCRGGVLLSAVDPPESGLPAVGTFTIGNSGAAGHTYQISFPDLPAGWAATAKVGGVQASEIAVAANATGTVIAEVTPDARALAGTVNVTGRFSSVECGVYEDVMPVVVAPFLALSIDAVNENASAPAGGVAVYDVNVRNDGNAPTPIGLLLTLFAPTFELEWSFEGPGNAAGSPANGTASFPLGAYSTGTLRLFVTIPSPPPSRIFELVLIATASDGSYQTLRLNFSIALADLGFATLLVDPSPPVANQSANVSVAVVNRGQTASRGGDVRLLIDGLLVANQSLGPVPANGSVTVVFPWLPAPGNYTLTAEVWIGAGEEEFSSADNVISLRVIVAAPATQPGTQQQPPPPPPATETGAMSPILAAGLLGGVAAAAALFAVMRRRKQAPPNP